MLAPFGRMLAQLWLRNVTHKPPKNRISASKINKPWNFLKKIGEIGGFVSLKIREPTQTARKTPS
jgi:hypothetical protein